MPQWRSGEMEMVAFSGDLASQPCKRHHPLGGFSVPPFPPKKTRVGAAGESSDISDDGGLGSVLAGDLAAASSSSPRGTTTPSTSAAATAVPRGFQLGVGSSYMPKKGGKLLGEDAHFISKAGNAFGVADGVGSWSRKGIDAGEFARQLMSSCEAQIRRLSGGGVIGTLLQGVLKTALAGTTARGTSTACVGAVDGPFLRVVCIGDSGFMVVRGGAVSYRSPPQQKSFNHPYQIGRVDQADPLDSAMTFKVQLAPGDVVVAATDGLFDNLFDEEIAALVTRKRAARSRRNALYTARALAQAAVAAVAGGKDTPFAAASRTAGHPRTCGKCDDVTVVVLTVDADENPSDATKKEHNRRSPMDHEPDEHRRTSLRMNQPWSGKSTTEAD